MPDEEITIGGRSYEVSCQPGEEHFLHSAASLIDAEAQTLLSQIGRMPETRMLLMAGLMLADKTAGIEEQLRVAESRVAELERTIAHLRSAPAQTERVEVPVIPNAVLDQLAQFADRAEALADETESRAQKDATG
ncbi:Cell division protein ZapA [Rhodobacteraceae bacterium THAF1]|uniref:cell division protein ZapA n=1 Tax=Palleronia sp. THAF1 TaxID=2587842 RepID=UPI000F3EF2B2|nr:cell division protein ZapA [Palleronia sp. THAF1]QFU08207.1 Cell division protein ZapA [Palleronia sp. THAF1]VDC28761.1 Cell division protein ZapA [Rhodobacteraceae bacterium THAF1]